MTLRQDLNTIEQTCLSLLGQIQGLLKKIPGKI